MRVVSNTTPISELSKIGQLELLKTVYRRITIPEAVLQELQQASSLPQLSATVAQASWIEVYTLHSPAKLEALQRCYTGIHSGEAAAIVLAQELAAQRLVLDDKRARQVARAEGLPIIGTVGVILVAYRLKRINKPEAEAMLDQLYQGAAYISVDLYRAAIDELRQAP